jgi:hypothetical protein
MFVRTWGEEGGYNICKYVKCTRTYTYAYIYIRIQWAAAGALGAIASGEEGREGVTNAGAVQYLCELAKSPDALEAVEGTRALQDLDEDCRHDHDKTEL